jgi:dTDP-4-dehydrorhamnose 3,5-epimerase
VLELLPLPDERGSFVELCRHAWLGREVPVQWNVVSNGPRALRGMHWHERHTDYLGVVSGALDVALVDLRAGSPSEGERAMVELRADRPQLLVVPAGVGHGFFTAEHSVVLYGVTRYWDLDDEFGFRWDDPEVAIPWPAAGPPVVSMRDKAMPALAAAGPRPAWSDLCARGLAGVVEDGAELLDGGADGKPLGAGGPGRRPAPAVGDEVA